MVGETAYDLAQRPNKSNPDVIYGINRSVYEHGKTLLTQNTQQ